MPVRICAAATVALALGCTAAVLARPAAATAVPSGPAVTAANSGGDVPILGDRCIKCHNLPKPKMDTAPARASWIAKAGKPGDRPV
jgi:cytochrome c5